MSIRKLAALAWLLYAARWAHIVLQMALAGEPGLATLVAVLPAVDAAIAWRIWAGRTPWPVVAGALWGSIWVASGTSILLYGPGLGWALDVFDWLGFLLQALATALSLATLIRGLLTTEQQRPPT